MLICASVGFILTCMKRKEFSPTLSFIFVLHMDSSESLAFPVPIKQPTNISTDSQDCYPDLLILIRSAVHTGCSFQPLQFMKHFQFHLLRRNNWRKNGFLPLWGKKPKQKQTPKKISLKLATKKAIQMKGPAEVLRIINLEIKIGTSALRTAFPLSAAIYGVFKTCPWFSFTHKVIL